MSLSCLLRHAVSSAAAAADQPRSPFVSGLLLKLSSDLPACPSACSGRAPAGQRLLFPVCLPCLVLGVCLGPLVAPPPHLVVPVLALKPQPTLWRVHLASGRTGAQVVPECSAGRPVSRVQGSRRAAALLGAQPGPGSPEQVGCLVQQGEPPEKEPHRAAYEAGSREARLQPLGPRQLRANSELRSSCGVGCERSCTVSAGGA